MNSELSKIFFEMSVLMNMKGVQFKPRAFEKAAHSLGVLEEDVREIYSRGGIKALEDIPGVGAGIAERIEEYIKTRHIKDYSGLKKQIPVDVEGLKAIEGVGPKTILLLYEKLGIKNREQLERAARAGKLRDIEGLGEKTEQKVLKGIEFLKQTHGRFILGFTMPTVRDIVERLIKVEEVERVEFAGSIRRMQETVGDLDILAISRHPEKVMDFFVSMPEVAHVYGKGEVKTFVRLKNGMDADLQVVPPRSFGAALQYFTGDKYHNIQLREAAIRQGYKLNEYGLYEGEKFVAGKTEEEVYKKLGFEWMPPELRTNYGELEASASGKLPHLVGYGDLKGDLQVQTDWTDGENSIEEMAKAARKQGLEYICITDHTKRLAMTGGLDDEKVLRQAEEIDRINAKLKAQNEKFRILKGTEVDILKDGSLDLKDETLAKLDVVGASVHSHFNLPEEEQTERIARAMENPNVDIIFHPTGRIIQKREAYKVNVEALIAVAKRTGTVLEINAYPDRLDLKDEYIRKAIDAGVKMSVDSDAHSTAHFQFLEYGIAQARRGWAEKKDIINAHSWQEMQKMLK